MTSMKMGTVLVFIFHRKTQMMRNLMSFMCCAIYDGRRSVLKHGAVVNRPLIYGPNEPDVPLLSFQQMD